MDACDPEINIKNLKTLIKQNIGTDLKLTRSQICDVYSTIQDGKLPLPPLVLRSDRTHLIDRKSPLTQKDYTTLFSSTSKVGDIRRLARKVGLINMTMTKQETIDSIGRRLRSLNVSEPIKLYSAKRRDIESNNGNFTNNSAFVNNSNNALNSGNGNTNMNSNINNVNNRLNNNVNNRVNNNVNNRVNNNINRNTVSNTNTRTNSNNRSTVSNTNTRTNFKEPNARPKQFVTVNFKKQKKPTQFLNKTKNVNKKPGVFAGLFGKGTKSPDFIPTKKYIKRMDTSSSLEIAAWVCIKTSRQMCRGQVARGQANHVFRIYIN